MRLRIVKKSVVADKNMKAKDVRVNSVKVGDNNTGEGQWQDAKKFGNNGAITSRNFGQQNSGYFANRG